MANTRQKAWWIARRDSAIVTTNPDVLGTYIGVVEKATNAITRGGKTSDWQSISYSENDGLWIYGIITDANLEVSDGSTDEYLRIPIQFHEAIVSKAIADAYKTPPNLNLQNATFFEAEYLRRVKDARKFSRARYSGSGVVSPQSF